MRKAVLLVAVFFALFLYAPVQAIDVNNPPAGVFADEWYVALFNGRKAGYMHTTMERIQRPGSKATSRDRSRTDHIRMKLDMVLELGRGGSPIKIESGQETTETLDGRPVSFRNRMQLGLLPAPSVTQGRFENGKVIVSSSQFGQQTEEKTYDLPAGAMMSWAVYREQLKRGLKPGTRYELPTYDPSFSPSRITPMVVEVLQRQTIDLFGRKVEATKTKQIVTLSNPLGQSTPVETITWMTSEGDAVRLEMTIMSIPIQIVACTKSVALSPNDPAEVMVDNLIPVEGPIDRNANRIVYRITLKSASGSVVMPALPETDIQKVEKKDKNSVQVCVTRRVPGRAARQGQPLSAADRARYLAASAILNYKDSVVAKLAKEAAGSEKDPWKLADRLQRFVAKYVAGKGLSIGFASAGEVARSKEGDCTEHGVLLAALGRAVGIPTRLVTGVLYGESFLGRSNVFVGHLWTQFWIEGQWVDLDSAWGQTVVDPTHIAMSISDAGEAGYADLVNSVWLNLGKLTIRVMRSEKGNHNDATRTNPCRSELPADRSGGR